MGRITDIPTSVTPAGLTHDYTNEPDIPMVFVSVPWNSEYTDAPLSQAGVDALIAAEVSAGRAFQASGVKAFYPDVAFDADISLASARQYNYVRATLPGGRKWYSFVTSEFLNKNVTRFTPSTDSWVTYDFSVGLSFVERGHVGVAASQNDATGALYCLEPEPIAVGDMETVAVSDYDVFADGVNIVVLSTTNLTTTTPFRDQAIAKEPYTRIPMGEITHNQQRGVDEIPYIDTHTTGNIPSGLWPFPADDYAYEAGVNLSVGDREPMNWPWVDGNDAKVPSVTPIAPSLINGIPAAGGVFVYANFQSFARHMSVLAHVPWVMAGIEATYVIPAGLYGATGASTSALPESLENRGYATTQGLVEGAVGLAAYKPTVTYSRNFTVNLRSGWRGVFDAGIYKKLNTSQFAEVELTDRNGGSIRLAPEQWDSTNAGVTVERTALEAGELTIYATGYPGATENPIHLGYSVSPPTWENGRDNALMRTASSWLANRGMSVWRYLAEVRDKAYAKYASQAQDGYTTALQWSVGKMTGVL